MKKINLLEIQVEDRDSGEKKQANVMKKVEEKLAAQTAMVQKLKLQNSEV